MRQKFVSFLVVFLLIGVLLFALTGCSTVPEDDTSSAPVTEQDTQSSDSVDESGSNEENTYSGNETVYTFRSEKLLEEHFEKHGREMGYASAQAYETGANSVINDPDSLHKTEAEDGDDVYYLESTNEFVIVSTDGYIRTYFYPDSGIDYYYRQ